VRIGGGYSIQFRTAPELHGILGEWEPRHPVRIRGQAARKYVAARTSFLKLLATHLGANIELLDLPNSTREQIEPMRAGRA